jgi:Flp pilus assembly protein TadG
MDKTKIIRNKKGTTLVETAIIIMLLLTFIFGIIEFGLLLFDKQVLTNASREGARAGIVVGLGRSGGNNAQYLTVSKNVASGFCADHLVTFGSGDLNVSASYNDQDGSGSPSRGDVLTVSLTYNYDFLVLSAFGIGPIPLNAVSGMKLE